MKLIYFGVRGRVEPARLMLELTKTPYEFEAIVPADWAKTKVKMLERTPLGQLPVLEDGDFSLCQSGAINRYVARKLGLAGDTITEQARVDEVCETAGDLIFHAAQLNWNPEFTAMREKNREETKARLESLDNYFARMGANDEFWISPGKYTLGDVLIAYALETMMPLHPGLVDGFPRLHHMMNTFFSADGIREYVRSDRRAKTWTVPMAFFAGKPEETHQWTGE
jgi:glutathione S-transferase